MNDILSGSRLDQAQRLALVQSSWSQAERRRRRELASFRQRRLAWQLALETTKASDSQARRA